MIVKKTHKDHVHIYSDKGLKIRQKETKRVYVEAIEIPNCPIQYTYEEVEE